MKPKHFPFITLMLVVLSSFAQSDSLYIDSLRKVLITQKQDTNKVNTLLNLSMFFEYQVPAKGDSVMKYVMDALHSSDNLGYLPGLAKSYEILSRNNLVENNLTEAYSYAKKSVQLFKELNLPDGELGALNMLAIILAMQKNFTGQIELFKQCEKIAFEIGDSDRRQQFTGNIGSAFNDINQFDSAKLYYKKAIDISKKIGNLASAASWLSNLGLACLNHAEYQQAQLYFEEALKFQSRKNDQFWIGEVYYGIGRLKFWKGDLDSALFFGEKSFDLERQLPDSFQRIINPAQLLSDVYERKSNYERAFYFKKLLTIARDSLYNNEGSRQLSAMVNNDRQHEQDMIEARKEFRNRIVLVSSICIIVIIMIIAFLLYRNYRQQKIANKKISIAYQVLKSTQAQLIQSEKMASLGQLTAGIAHEIQNPLNFVNNFSEVNGELIDELVDEVNKGNKEEAKFLAADLKQNLEKITHHGKRADAIVKGMLEHSRQGTGERQTTDVNKLVDEYLKLAYNGIKAKDPHFEVILKTNLDNNAGKIVIIPQDIGRVLLNLYTNAFYTVNEKGKLNIPGYEARVETSTKRNGSKIEIRVVDNGNGIPTSIIDKIFQPFFTTKPTGQGTGLGLSLSYDIIKAHGGDLKVTTKEARPDDPAEKGEGLLAGQAGTEFMIQLPINN
ncbi:MAG: tetratricopeptide repeat protein [Bacteroidetes bacterium]|nr:tetratricopeptide repeat protein [Bacteroidota bacterium]